MFTGIYNNKQKSPLIAMTNHIFHLIHPSCCEQLKKYEKIFYQNFHRVVKKIKNNSGTKIWETEDAQRAESSNYSSIPLRYLFILEEGAKRRGS